MYVQLLMAANVEGACSQFSGDDVLLEQPDTRMIRDGNDLGSGTLSITEKYVADWTLVCIYMCA